MLEASQYDSYAYLFTKPTFISLDPNASVSNFDLSGVRIGINGREARVGQSYSPLSVSVGGSNYAAATGQLLSQAGAVIALEKGPVADEFFLTFEQIGPRSNPFVEEPHPIDNPTRPTVLADPKVGMRTFDELAATYSKLTGVASTTPSVASTYANVKQQLPSVESIDAFLASHQTGIAQLAIAYCSAMVDNQTLRTSFFGSIDPTQPASIFTNPVNQAPVIQAINTKIIGNFTTQTTSTLVDTAIGELLTKIGGGSGTAGNAMKAACAAALGSAATTMQ
jgi:hypothetical protein